MPSRNSKFDMDTSYNQQGTWDPSPLSSRAPYLVLAGPIRTYPDLSLYFLSKHTFKYKYDKLVGNDEVLLKIAGNNFLTKPDLVMIGVML